MQKRLFIVIVLLLFTSPLAHASTADELRSQINALLQQIATIQAQLGISSQPATNTTTPSVTTTTGSATGSTLSNCPNLQYNLERGDTDTATAQEVTALQKFLAQDPTLYPEMTISGYYGTLTEAAVQRFQVRYGIVQAGNYQSTGYGRVGPKTRAAIASACTNTTTTTTTTTTNTANNNYMSFLAEPSSGAAPLAVKVTLKNTAASACTSYYVDWGDISTPLSYEAPAYANCNSASFTKTFTHTYVSPGTFTLSAKAGQSPLAQLTPVNQNITVYGGTTGISDDECFITPQSGYAPLAVDARVLLGGSLCDGQLAYYVDWGDGNVSSTNYCSDPNAHYETLEHTYTSSGSHTARLLQAHPSATFTESTCTINVNPTSTSIYGTSSATPSDSCKVWYDGCNTCSRAYVGGPLVCTMMACMLQGGTADASSRAYCREYFTGTSGSVYNTDTLLATITSTTNRAVTFNAIIASSSTCTSAATYTLYFGDGTDAMVSNTKTCSAFTKTLTHTYTNAGTYTAYLMRDGVAVDTITVTVGSTSYNWATIRSTAAVYNAESSESVKNILESLEKFLRMLFE